MTLIYIYIFKIIHFLASIFIIIVKSSIVEGFDVQIVQSLTFVDQL